MSGKKIRHQSLAHQSLIDILLILVLVIVLPSCSRLRYGVTPHQTAEYHAMRIKIRVENRHSHQKQRFKILLKYNQTRDKMLFLSPLNQIYGLLLVEGENALLINTKKKKYWKGPFRHLLQKLWDLDINYQEFKNLIVSGIMPAQEKLETRGIGIELEPGSSRTQPGQLTITTPGLSLAIRITHRRSGKGILSPTANLDGMSPSSISGLLDARD